MKLISLISGGIDSPVAAYLMLKQDAEVVAVHMKNSESENLEKIKLLVKQLEKSSGKNIKTYVVPHVGNQSEISKNCNRRFQCILCKRMMYHIAEEIAKKEKADAIVTGESIGQVASQTLQNLMVENSAVKIPILRPLIGFDKNDTIKIAREIRTYEISIKDDKSCPFVPNKPATTAKLEKILDEEKKIDVKKIVGNDVKNSTIL